MSTDSGTPIPAGTPFQPLLPRLRALRIRRVAFEAPALEHFRSSLARYREAIEFIVQTDGPVPVRAYGPAIWVGDVEINYSEPIDETTWRLLAFEPQDLKSGEPISWGWMKDPRNERQQTQYRYEEVGG
jgi:hypothetical protein